jgi:tRNA(fMet)-specific endonuclease VapC
LGGGRLSARYLLDATVVFAAASGEMATLAKLSRLGIGDVAISAIVYSELLAGAAASDKDPRLAENVALIAENLEILAFDRAAAETYGRLLREMDHKRRRALDRMVAAQALASKLTLVTLAPDNFADIPGLAIESWSI